MWGASEEPPGTMEAGPPEISPQATETCEQNKSQLESLKEIMLKNKQSLKKKEEEAQEYSSRLLKIKSRTKLSRRSKESASAPKDIQVDPMDEAIDDISQARTSKAKSSLLQRKLAENRKVFEQRNKEITETKKAVEEKVEAIRQQLEEKKDVTPVVTPVMVMPEIASPVQIQEMDNEIAKLNNKIATLKATIMDLQENLKEKDSVIDSKTKAITLMSADLSKKGKTTLDTLEETKDEMRAMQEHFVLLEKSLKEKNESLLKQLHERDSRISELDDTIKRYEHELTEQKLSETVQADLSRSTMDTLTDTKDAMKAMQENFVLIESSLKMKNDNLLQQLQDYETKLAEANERIFQLESGKGIVRTPAVEDLQYKLDRLEENNKKLQDEKYELQKSITALQDKILINKSINGNGATMEKDNRIAELENLIEELKKSNDLLREESKAELQKQLAELTVKNDEYSNKITDLESLVHKLESEKHDLIAQLPQETSTSDEKVQQLTKELEELNKTMIKIKAQNRSKVKNLQKQLENFKMVSDTNAELVRLANQVALLEEEKGNLQLSLVDFDELKASAGDWQERIADLESKVSIQTEEMQKHVDAIAILENQKLDLIQELHMVKQKVSSLEAEIADSENHRVTAEMKVVDLEEQLESVNKAQTEDRLESLPSVKELMNKIETLQQEKAELTSKLSKMEEKNSDASSTESFETIQEVDKQELMKRIEELTRKNDELVLKLAHSEEKSASHAGSTESFEAINDTDKTELLKKIDQLTQENSDLLIKLNRHEEKGSSDTGSTESFERIPEHNESTTSTLRESDSSVELTKLKAQVSEVTEENIVLQKRIEVLVIENTDLAIQCTKLEESLSGIKEEHSNLTERVARQTNNEDQINALIQEKSDLEKELANLQERLIQQSSNMSLQEIETNDTKLRMNALLEENSQFTVRITELEELSKNLTEELNRTIEEKEDLHSKMSELSSDNISQERLELIDKLEKLTQEKESVARERKELHEQISMLLHKSVEESADAQKLEQSVDFTDIASLEEEIKRYKELIAEQSSLIEELKQKLSTQEEELEIKTKEIYESSANENENLKRDLKEMTTSMEEWKFKYDELRKKMEALENDKAFIEDNLRMLQEENKRLHDEVQQKNEQKNNLQEELETMISTLRSKLEEESEMLSSKENEMTSLKQHIEEKSEELQNTYNRLQRENERLDQALRDLDVAKDELQEKESKIGSFALELDKLNDIIRSKEDEIYSLERKNSELHEKLSESVPSKEHERLLEELRDNEVLIGNLQSKIDERTKEKHELLMEMENLSQQNQDLQYQLAHKNEELKNYMTMKDELDVRVMEMDRTKAELEKKIWELENSLGSNTRFTEDLQSELRNVYKMMEQLKAKHVEDVEMYKRRLEDIIEELNVKSQECDSLRNELQEKDKLIAQNFTEQAKAALEAKVEDLEAKLGDYENKIQAQLEKMKKIAATLKKKTSLCQELQERVVELEEKWTTEKDEKEARNKKSQEFENSIREKDNKITELEEKLAQVKTETFDYLQQIDKLTNELDTWKEKTSLLTNQTTECDKEMEKLRIQMDENNSELAQVKQSKENLIEEYESYKKEMTLKREQEQQVLDEVKEKARELSVRMQVMESEYMDQLALIKNLQAENGLLFSKQTQINEKLENVEKESEERRLIIEQLQKDVTESSIATTQTLEEDWGAQDVRTSMVQRCDHCEQCQTTVQALEAKLQEREAEIENLDNELANSIGNFVQMRESMRFNDMMNQSNIADRNLGDSYSDLLFRYTALASSNEETTARLESTIKENEELEEKIKNLQALNVTLKERIVDVEQEVRRDEEAADQPQIPDSSHADLVRKCESQEEQLQKLQEELQVARNRLEALNSEREELAEKYRSSMDQMDGLRFEIASLSEEKNADLRKLSELELEVEKLKEKNVTTEVDITDLKDQPSKERYEAPPLFDASKIFGTPSSDSKSEEAKEVARLRNLLEDRNVQYATLKEEVNNLRRQLDEERIQMSQNYNIYEAELKASQERCQSMQEELEYLQQTLQEKTKEIDSLTEQTTSLHVNTSQENLWDSKIQALQSELKSTEEALRSLNAEKGEQDRLLKTYESRIRDMEQELENSTTNSELVRELEERISQLIKERDVMQLEKNDLTRSLEESQQLNVTVAPTQKFTTNLDGSGSNEKLNVDEEVWGWNEEDAQLADNRHVTQSAITLSTEIQLRTMVEELQDKVKQLEAEQARLIEENAATQVRSKKLVKKLKEYKIQTESLQQQLKSQGTTAGFYDLDSAIEEELKSQIAELEKSLKELNEEHKKVVAEKEALLKRLDVVVSANERYMEMKERQDMDVEVLRIQNADLANKIKNMELKLTQEQREGNSTGLGEASRDEQQVSPETPVEVQESVEKHVVQKRSVEEGSKNEKDAEMLCNKYKEELDDLKDEMEALATENEQLQNFLEEQKLKISSLEAKLTTEVVEQRNLEEVQATNVELRNSLENSEKERDSLRKQLEESLVHADQRISEVQARSDALQAEIRESSNKFTEEINYMRQQLEESRSRVQELEIRLQNALEEKLKLEQQVSEAKSAEERLSVVSSSLADVTDLLNSRVQEVADLKQELQKQYVGRQEAEKKLQENIQVLNQELQEKKQEFEALKEAFSDKENELIQQKSMETVSAVVSQATQELVQKHAIELEEKHKEIRTLQERIAILEATVNEYSSQLTNNDLLQEEMRRLREELSSKQSSLESANQELEAVKEKLRVKRDALDNRETELQRYAADIEKYLANISHLENRLRESEFASLKLQEQLTHVSSLEEEISNLRALLSSQNTSREEGNDKMQPESQTKEDVKEASVKQVCTDSLPLFRMSSGTEEKLQEMVEQLQASVIVKDQEIEHLNYLLEENTYPRIIEEMQDNINSLYNEKAHLESSLQAVSHSLTEERNQVQALTQRLSVLSEEFNAKEEIKYRERRSLQDQEEIMKLQNEIHAKEQEINELKYVIAEKDSQLSHQASMDPSSDEYELRETVERLTAELYAKEQEIAFLKSTVTELEKKVQQLKEFERLSEENKDLIERLNSEKEEIRLEAEKNLQKKLAEKEMEIDEIKRKLSLENEKLLQDLQLREKDVENLKRQLEYSYNEWNEALRRKEEDLFQTTGELAEKDRRLSELTIRKDSEIQNLMIQLHEKDVRIEELLALSDKEKTELSQLKEIVESREMEIEKLKYELEGKLKEYETIQRALSKEFPGGRITHARSIDDSAGVTDSSVSALQADEKDQRSNEHELALYMLHQRDVRCEELTHELMQLLEERDTLQLRLSNAIRINEELRKVASLDSTPRKEVMSQTMSEEPSIEHPSPSKSTGPVEIAKEAIDTTISEDKEALSLKLSQLHTVGHTKDVRLRDDRELRHTQQMSLLAHKDVLSTLPPEAAARLVNANYTLSRDVQSQSSVLLNWLWGKSTPKVVHM